MLQHNKVLGYPTEICDFVLGDGSYYSLFPGLDTSQMEYKAVFGFELTRNFKYSKKGVDIYAFSIIMDNY